MKAIGVSLIIMLMLVSASSVEAVEIDRSSLTVLGITPGVSRFSDVFRTLGETPMWQTGDAALSETRICYRLPDHSRESIILFASNSEMAGPPSYLEGHVKFFGSCIKQPVLPSDPNYEKFSNLKGCFKDDKGGWEGEPYYDICAGVGVLFIKGTLVYLTLRSGTSVC